MGSPQETYDPNQTYLVDHVGGNWLIRGNMPLNDDGTFAYTALNEKLKTLLPEGFDLSMMTVIDVSLIDNQGELPSLECEFTSFGAGTPPTAWQPYPAGILFNGYGDGSVQGDGVSGMGSLLWMPIQGCDEGQCEVQETTLYDFDGVVSYIRGILTSNVSNQLMYIHCMNGHDRAGSLTCGYQMKYLGISMADAMAEGEKIMGHSWHHPYKHLIEWYAGTL